MMELGQLNQISSTKSFEIPQPETLRASRFEKWSPDSIAPWTYLPAYQNLTDDMKLRYNQLHALTVNELFIWFEQKLLLPILSRLIDQSDQDLEFKLACQIFYKEEVKHSEMFRRLSKSSAPELYKKTDFYFFNSRFSISRWLMETSLKFPQTMSTWCWILIFFEERTLMYSKEYLKAKGQVSGVYSKVHHLHMIEEARHVQLDKYFIEKMYTGASDLNRKITAYIFGKVLESFSSPKRMSMAIAERMKMEFVRPEEHLMIDQIALELPMLKDNLDFKLQFFGIESTEGTFNLMSKYPEFDQLKKYFLA